MFNYILNCFTLDGYSLNHYKIYKWIINNLESFEIHILDDKHLKNKIKKKLGANHCFRRVTVLEGVD